MKKCYTPFAYIPAPSLTPQPALQLENMIQYVLFGLKSKLWYTLHEHTANERLQILWEHFLPTFLSLSVTRLVVCLQVLWIILAPKFGVPACPSQDSWDRALLASADLNVYFWSYHCTNAMEFCPIFMEKSKEHTPQPVPLLFLSCCQFLSEWIISNTKQKLKTFGLVQSGCTLM